MLFNYIYADILKLFFNPSLQKEAAQRLASGYEGTIHVTQGFALFAALVPETAIAMVLLSRVLGYRANRWANIIVGALRARSPRPRSSLGTHGPGERHPETSLGNNYRRSSARSDPVDKEVPARACNPLTYLGMSDERNGGSRHGYRTVL